MRVPGGARGYYLFSRVYIDSYSLFKYCNRLLGKNAPTMEVGLGLPAIFLRVTGETNKQPNKQTTKQPFVQITKQPIDQTTYQPNKLTNKRRNTPINQTKLTNEPSKLKEVLDS